MSHDIQKIIDLPSIAKIKRISQGLALLDAIIMPEWEYRYFSFNCNWDEKENEMMASMRSGSGSEYFLLFSKSGVVGKVLFEEQITDASLQLKNIPDCFASFKNEPAFNLDVATFFFWRTSEDNEWSASTNYSNTYGPLNFLIDGYSGYQSWAENYYEKSINNEALKNVFTSLNVTSGQLAILNPDLSLEELSEDLKEITDC